MLTKNPLFYLVLVLALTVGMLAVNFVKAVDRAAEQPFSFFEPTEPFPEGNPELPIDISSSAQIKKGELTVSELVITPSTETKPLYLKGDGIYMKKNSDAEIPSPKIYWDQITSWSNVSNSDDIYYSGSVGIGTNILTSGVKLNVDGQIDMNNNRIINVGRPTSATDAATKEYVDSKAEKTLRGEGSGDAWDYSSGDETVTTPLGEWDFCFLTGFDRDSEGGNLHRIKKSRCELTESSGEWTLTTQSDNKGHTRCGARCVKFGEAVTAVVTVPAVPTGFSADWACHRACHGAGQGGQVCNDICGVKLSWVDVDNETGYEIWRDGGFLSSPGQNVTQADGGDVDSGITYNYTIKACNNSGCSTQNSTSITTP